MYSYLPVEAGLLLEIIGVGKKEATFFENDGWYCLKSEEPAAGDAFACVLALSKREHLKAIVCVILKWPRTVINSLNGFLLAAQA